MPKFRKALFSRESPFARKGEKERQQYIQDLFRAARNTWPAQWDDKDYILTTVRGMNALILLITDSVQYTNLIGKDFSADHIQAVIKMAAKYNWSLANNKGKSVEQIVDGLNRSIASKSPKEA